jgi:4-hydroxy-tetrahydrodipicolinate synthase
MRQQRTETHSTPASLKEKIVDQAQLKQMIQGPLAAVPTAFNADYSIDPGGMADLTDWWIEQGVANGRTALKVTAAIGEGPDLADAEWPQILDAVVKRANDRVPIIAGLKTTGTYQAIQDVKRAQSLGAVCVQIDLPFLHHPTQDDYVRYFTDISDAVDIGVLIYNTWWFAAPSLTPETMLRLSDAEQVIAIKWSVPPDGSVDYDDMTQFADRFNVIDNSLQWIRCHKNGGRGHISATTHAWPAQQLHVWDLLEAGKYDEAQAEYDRVETPVRKVMNKVSARSGGYQTAKALLDLLGHSAGPARPPSIPLNQDELTELRDVMRGFGWPVVEA